MAESTFELICRHKDSNPSNLNEVFSSYGCSTLEAKVPVVSDPVVEKLKVTSGHEQVYATLALKNTSATYAMEGRMARTRNKPLSVVAIGDETVISAGKTRERSPVDRADLDNEIEEYMRIAAKIKAERTLACDLSNVKLEVQSPSRIQEEPRRERLTDLMKRRARLRRNATTDVENFCNRRKSPVHETAEELDMDLQSYMREAARIRAQKKDIAEQSDRMDLMEEMEFSGNVSDDDE